MEIIVTLFAKLFYKKWNTVATLFGSTFSKG
jgi:hypothetical protein